MNREEFIPKKASDDKAIESGDGYIDEVGGTHIEGRCRNPMGAFCGECGRASCKGCAREFIEVNYKRIRVW